MGAFWEASVMGRGDGGKETKGRGNAPKAHPELRNQAPVKTPRANAPSIDAFWCSRTQTRAMVTPSDACCFKSSIANGGSDGGPAPLPPESEENPGPDAVFEDEALALSRDSVIP